jgi:hypothetical protein
MFLETHIPPLPEGVIDTTTLSAKPWRAELTRLIDGAWIAIEAFQEVHKQNKSDKVHVFKKFMTERDWGTGPPALQERDGSDQLSASGDKVQDADIRANVYYKTFSCPCNVRETLN